jgi:hypothetical protein
MEFVVNLKIGNEIELIESAFAAFFRALFVEIENKFGRQNNV